MARTVLYKGYNVLLFISIIWLFIKTTCTETLQHLQLVLSEWALLGCLPLGQMLLRCDKSHQIRRHNLVSRLLSRDHIVRTSTPHNRSHWTSRSHAGTDCTCVHQHLPYIGIALWPDHTGTPGRCCPLLFLFHRIRKLQNINHM